MCECEVCMGVILTLSTIAGFVLLILICCFLKFNPESLDKYKYNWNLSPISSIEIRDTECKGDEYSLINNTFYGTFDYCDCTNSTENKYKGKDYLDVCEKEQGEAKCSTIVGQNKTQILKWRNKYICAKKMSKNYSDFIELREGSESKIKIDTESNGMYKKVDEKVISSIEIKKKNSEILNQECKDLDDEYQICYTNGDEGNATVEVIISQDKNGICISENEGVFSENEFKYNRKKGSKSCVQSNSGKYIDLRYQNIDKNNYSYISLLKENKIEKYSYLNLTENDTVSLYAINYFGIKKNCFDGKQKVDFLFEKKITAVQVLSIISCVFAGFFALFTTISSISEDWNGDTDGIHKFFAGFIGILIVISEIILFVRTSDQAYFYTNNCFDDITFESYWKMYWHIWISKILIGCCICIYGLNLFYPKYMSELF